MLHQPRVAIGKIVADDVTFELDRLEKAIEAMRASVDALIDRSDDGRAGEHRDVLEAFRMIAHDRGWLRRLREAVTSGLTAEAAVERVQNDARARLQRQTDPYLRDRLHDLTDIANRLLHQLAGQSLVLLPSELPENAILVARSMSPAALLDYDRSRLRGVVLEEAGASSHIAIVARALAIPGGQRHSQHLRDRRTGRRDHRRRPHRRSAASPRPRHREGLRRQGAPARAPPGPVPRAARHAERHARRR